MKIERPRFELARVYADGTSETPEIIPVGTMPWDTLMERRGFLGVGVGVASLLLLLDGKAAAQGDSPTKNQTNDLPTRVPDKGIFAHKSVVRALAISPDGKILASGSDDKTIKLWSLPDGKLLATLNGHKDDVMTLAISPSGKTLASGSFDKTIKLWSFPEGKLLATLNGHKGLVRTLVISADGKTLVSGSADNTIRLWTLPEGKPLAALEGHKDIVLALAISPDGQILASGSADYAIYLWSLPNGKLLATLTRDKEFVEALAITPDGKLLVSVSSNGILEWSMPSGKLLGTLEEGFVSALAMSPDGKCVASYSNGKTIKLWTLTDGKLFAALEGNEQHIQALAISPDERILASGGLSGMIILWDLERRSFLSFLFDPKASQTNAISYNIYDKITGRTVTFTLPCGSPIPPGAVCTCNCVPGTYRPSYPTGGGGGGGGTYCTCNKVCTCIPVPSDREVKESFETADPLTILQRLAELPIQTWNYNWDDASVRHIGPMAQDFAAAFAVGEDDKHIHPVDAQGVAFAAIQGLYQLLKEKEGETRTLQAQLHHQQEENQILKSRIEALERTNAVS